MSGKGQIEIDMETSSGFERKWVFSETEALMTRTILSELPGTSSCKASS
jgi:hypothetical protein